MIKILELPLEEDLAPLYRYLRSHNVPIRIIESSGQQEVWVPDERFRDLTLELYQRYQQDPQMKAGLDQWQARSEASGGSSFWTRRLIALWHAPVVWAGLLGMALVALLGYLGGVGEAILFKLFFADIFASDYGTLDERLTMLAETLGAGEWWRLVTPALLHGGAMHLIFNSLWYWYLGVRVEREQGSVTVLLLILITAVGSNLGQYLVSGPAFGGMSGVVYGLFGYVGWRMFFAPRPGLMVPPAILAFALVWLLLGYTGIKLMPGQGDVANTAHLSGLLLGILFAWFEQRVIYRHR